MNLKTVDFQILTSNYVKYRDGVEEIENKKKEFLEKIEPLKKKMNDIIKYAQSGLIVDEQSQKSKSQDFQDLQREAISMDNDFKYEIRQMSDSLNEKCYDDLEEIITEWSINNNIDLVLGKMEVVFNKPEFEATNEILDILKEKGLYVDYDKNEKED